MSTPTCCICSGVSWTSVKTSEKSGDGALAKTSPKSRSLPTPERSMFMPLRSMFERSSPLMSRLMPSPRPERVDSSKWKADFIASSSTENMLWRSTPFFASAWTSSKDLPVKTSTSGFASCCWTI